MPAELISLVMWYTGGLMCLVIYAFIVNRLRIASQPLRLKFAELGQELVNLKVLPRPHQRALENLLDGAFNGWKPWILVLAIPTYAIGRLVGLVNPVEEIENERVRRIYVKCVALGFVSSITLSPLALVIFLVEAFVLTMLYSFRDPRNLARIPITTIERLSRRFGSHSVPHL